MRPSCTWLVPSTIVSCLRVAVVELGHVVLHVARRAEQLEATFEAFTATSVA